ncbi:hypothetical protein EON65_01750 [archaeon]|nr:MAG: hypothetical protein EON65_01750 [archaeon]
MSDQVFDDGRRSALYSSNNYVYIDSALEETSGPSTFPSQFPTSIPLSFPSTSPSQSPSHVVNYECVDLASLRAPPSNQTIWFSNGFDSGYSGSVSVWQTFVTHLQQLRLISSPIEFMFVTLSNECFTRNASYPSPVPQPGSNVSLQTESLFSVQQCQDKNAVSSIWTSVTNSRAFSINCGNNKWTGYTSSGGKYLVSMNGTWNEDSARFILGVTMRSNMLSWPEWFQKSSAAVNTITIDYNMSFPGLLYCAAYDLPAPELSTSLTIWQAKFRASVSAFDFTHLSGSLLITGLAPSTEYVVYCFTEGFWNDADSTERSPLSATLLAANSVKTALPPESVVNVNVPFVFTIQGMTSAAISVSASYLSSNISIIPQLSYLGPSSCAGNLDPSTLLVSALAANDSSYVVSPQILLFNQGDLINSIDLFIKTKSSGCYLLSFLSSLNFSSNSTSALVNINSPLGLFTDMLLINSTQNPSYTFAATSAKFSSDGLGIEIRFSDFTDSGAALKLPVAFPCNRILNFTAAATSSCSFDRAFLLRAKLPATEVSLPMPGDRVVLLGNSLKPACSLLPVGSDCSMLDFIRETSLELNGDAVIPTAAVAAPMEIAVGQDLTLDISLSSGNGGRPWKTIRWAVASNYSLESASFSTLALQDLMNNGSMAWTYCIPDSYKCNRIPMAYLTHAGMYSFVLSLRNFAGKWATAACTVRVVSDPVPSVYIFGSSVSTLFTNQTTIIRSVVATNELACSTFSISWLVYENGILRRNMQSTNPRYRDSRTLVIDPFKLNPGSEYTFSVSVLCGAYSSIDQVTRYVSPCEAVASLRNGNSIFASLNNPIVLDASGSYMSCISGSANDTTFQWSCVQRSPLNDSGCNAFYSSLKTMSVSSSSLVFNNPELVFVSGATYMITVKVVSAHLRVSDSTSQSLTILGKVDLVVPVVSIIEKHINIDGSFRHTLDGYVSSSESVLAEWTLTTINRTIVSRTLYDGNLHYFPAVFPPELIIGRSSFTFRLRAMTVTESCNDFRCASPSVVSSSSMRIFVNQPPTSGLLTVSPSVGFDDIMFTLAAQHWHDDNLPLFYTFHQSAFNPDLDYYMIRNRMQLPFVSTTLTASGHKTSTVQLRLWVFDSLMAKAEMFSTATVYERAQNVTVMLNRVQETSAIVQQLLNPEILLPSLNVIISLSENCTQEGGAYCAGIAETGSRALRVSVDKYNAGTSLLHGLSSYLRALAQIDSVDLMPLSTSLLQVYNYLVSSSRVVGFSVGDGSRLVERLLQSCDSLISVLQLRDEVLSSEDDVLNGDVELLASARHLTVENSEDMVYGLMQSIYALSSDYFSAFPFGYTETIQSSSFFNVSIKKSFWDEMAEARSELVFDEALSISSPQFISSVTASYSALVLTNTASYFHSRSTNKTKVLHTRYVDFSLTSNNAAVPATLSLLLPEALSAEMRAMSVPMVLSNQTNSSSIVTLHRQCNDTEPVICSSSMTRGPAYTFPTYSCQGSNNSMVVAYSCPLYNSSFMCLDNYAVASYPITERTNQTFHCTFPVLLKSQVATEKQPAVSIKGSYSLALNYYELYPASQTETSKPTAKPVPPPTSDVLSNLSNDQKVSYLAIIGISISGIAFLAFIYNRVKAAQNIGTNFDLVVPRTQASYVRPVTTVDLESVAVETGEAKGEIPDEMVVRDVERIDVQAVAFPLVETRPDRLTARTTYYMPGIDANEQYRAGGTFNLQDLYMSSTHGSRHGRRLRSSSSAARPDSHDAASPSATSTQILPHTDSQTHAV